VAEEINVEVTDNVGEWTKFLKKQYRREIAEISREYPHRRSLVIDYRKILNNRLAFELLRSPGKVIGDIRDAIVQNKLLKLKEKTTRIRFTNPVLDTLLLSLQESVLWFTMGRAKKSIGEIGSSSIIRQ